MLTFGLLEVSVLPFFSVDFPNFTALKLVCRRRFQLPRSTHSDNSLGEKRWTECFKGGGDSCAAFFRVDFARG